MYGFETFLKVIEHFRNHGVYETVIINKYYGTIIGYPGRMKQPVNDNVSLWS